LGEEVALLDMNPRGLAERVADPVVRRLALQCLVLLAMADGKISPEEAALNRKYAEALGYKTEFAALESEVVSWVKSGDVGPLFV
jgi:tellurite resistance protein